MRSVCPDRLPSCHPGVPVFLLLAVLGLGACNTTHGLGHPGEDRRICQLIGQSDAFSGHHTGFALYDPEHDTWLCRREADKYYLPASNIKILTLLTAMHVLQDSIETIRYTVQGDTLLFEGCADPSFLYWGIRSNGETFRRLRDFNGVVCYLPPVAIPPYGKGWAWDDYVYGYQSEKSVFPMYGNRVRFTGDGYGNVETIPGYFSDYVMEDSGLDRKTNRDPVTNTFVVNPDMLQQGDTVSVPNIVSDFEVARILGDTLHREVCLEYVEPASPLSHVIRDTARDTLLKRMMQVSDNFIAEELLMQCAYQMRGTYNSDSAIAVAERMIFAGTPQVLRWVDGSGLSRMNLLTPESVVWTLDQILRLSSEQYVMDIFPTGGKSGTISEWYGDTVPFVFAKTGSLSGVHCLSGYLRTKKGRLLIFSFMHNHYIGSSIQIKEEMSDILKAIRDRY